MSIKDNIPSLKGVIMPLPQERKSGRRIFPQFADNGIQFDKVYLVIGEVSETHHFILLDYSTGKIMPGMYHIEDFVEATEDDF